MPAGGRCIAARAVGVGSGGSDKIRGLPVVVMDATITPGDPTQSTSSPIPLTHPLSLASHSPKKFPNCGHDFKNISAVKIMLPGALGTAKPKPTPRVGSVPRSEKPSVLPDDKSWLAAWPSNGLGPSCQLSVRESASTSSTTTRSPGGDFSHSSRFLPSNYQL